MGCTRSSGAQETHYVEREEERQAKSNYPMRGKPSVEGSNERVEIKRTEPTLGKRQRLNWVVDKSVSDTLH